MTLSHGSGDSSDVIEVDANDGPEVADDGPEVADDNAETVDTVEEEVEDDTASHPAEVE